MASFGLLFLHRQNYLADEHRSANFGVDLYTDRATSPMIIGECFFLFVFLQTELLRQCSSESVDVLLYTDRTRPPIRQSCIRCLR